VAAGGSTGQFLSKASGTNYDTTWATIVPGDRYLTTSTTSLTINNANKTLTVGTGLSYTPTQSVTISYDASKHMHGEVLTYNSGTGVMTVDVNHHSGSGTYSAWVVNVGGVTPVTSTAWGAITGTLSAQTDLQTALDAKLSTSTAASTYYPLSNPSAFITSSALTGYATESWVTSQGYLTSSSLTGYATESWVTSLGYLTDAPSDGNEYVRKNAAWAIATGGGGGAVWGGITGVVTDQTDLVTYVTGLGYQTASDVSTYVTGQGYLTDAPSDSQQYVRYNGGWSVNAGFTFGDSPTDGNYYVRMGATGWAQIGNSTDTIATQVWVGSQSYLTDAPSDGTPYARQDAGWVSVSTPALAANQLTAGVVTANPTTGPTATGDVLQYNGTDLVWAAGGGLTISTLSNGATSTLNPTAPTSGQALIYNGTDLVWETPVAPGPSVSSTVSSSYSSYTLVSGDASNFVHIDQASYVTVYIPSDSTYSFPIGSIVRIAVENASYLQVSPESYGSAPNVNGANTNTPVFLTSSGSQVINCVKVAADRWVVS
jgi:hypothetical protein